MSDDAADRKPPLGWRRKRCEMEKQVVMVRYEISGQSLRQLQRNGNGQRNDRWGLVLASSDVDVDIDWRIHC
jgi:hypothetical protein